MKGKGRWCLTTILVLTLASMGIAFQNEPEGFRGLQWGDPPGEDMVFTFASGSMDIYERPADKMNIGDVRLRRVEYGFYQNRFLVAMVRFIGDENYDLLKVILTARYGKPTDEGFLQFTWWSSDTNIILSRPSMKNDGYLSIADVRIFGEMDRAIKQEAIEKAADDF